MGDVEGGVVRAECSSRRQLVLLTYRLKNKPPPPTKPLSRGQVPPAGPLKGVQVSSSARS